MTIVKRKPDMTSEDYTFLVRTLNIFFICGPAEKRVQAAEYLNEQRDRIVEHESKSLVRKRYKSWVPKFIFMTFSGYFIAVGILYLISLLLDLFMPTATFVSMLVGFSVMFLSLQVFDFYKERKQRIQTERMLLDHYLPSIEV